MGDWPDEICDDCGKKGTDYHHWGYLTGGELKKLCGKCMHIRNNKSRGLCEHGNDLEGECAGCNT